MDGKKELSIKHNHYIATPPLYVHPLTAGGGYKEAKPDWNDSAAYWLGLYFFFNLGLTLFNKVVLVSFPFPYVRPLPL